MSSTIQSGGPPPRRDQTDDTQLALGLDATSPQVTATPECLSDDEILSYRQGETSEPERMRIHAHLDLCSICREIVHFVVQDEQRTSNPSLEVTTFLPGDLVKARYRIEGFIGKGGMGEVYRCFDQLLAKAVALKTVLCASGDDPHAVRKLFDEVRNAQRVAHPHVCRIYELQEHEDPTRYARPVPFFTMEFVEGERLSTRLRTAPLSNAQIREIALQLLQGLKAAHDKGVLHLDFKGDNVLLRRQGSSMDAVVMDFGLSRAADGESSVRTSERLRGAGTLPYMALEQIECRADVGPPADVYAFGVVLYEMLTGRLPFESTSPAAMLLKQLRDRPPPASKWRPGLSRLLDAFLAKCLSADPKSRYADAGAALAALERVGPWEAPGAARPRRRRVLLVALLVALAGGGALALPRSSEHTRAAAPPAAASEATSSAGLRPAPDERKAAAAHAPDIELGAASAAVVAPTVRAERPGAAAPARSSEKRRAAGAPASAAPAKNPAWTPRAVPSGGFWQPAPAPDAPARETPAAMPTAR